MAVNKIELKRSAVPGKVPTTSSLSLGELALNTFDGKVFLKKDNGSESIIELATTSGSILSSSYAATSSFASNFTVAGTITAQQLIVQTISSSVIYSSGSNVFGDASSDNQIFTGSVLVSGSITVSGSVINNLTASYAVNSDLLDGLDSTQFVQTGSFGAYTSSLNDFSASINNYTASINAKTSSFATTGSNQFNGNQSISGSLNVQGSITGSFSGSISNIQGNTNYIAKFGSPNTLNSSSIYQSGSSVIINQIAATEANPEALYVWQSSTSSFNVISGKGNLDNYLQLNIQNTNNGPTASSDVVATANNGNEFTNYIDMGINGGNFSGPIGEANDAYLYSTGRHLHIGNVSNYPVQFFVGGDDTDANRKFQLNPDDIHSMTGSLVVSGSITTSPIVVNNLTASYAMSASQAISSSYANQATNSDTASFAGNYTLTSSFNGFATASNAASASINLFTASINSYTASTNLTIADILVETASINRVTASLHLFTASINSYTASTNLTIADILVETASLQAATSSLYLATASLYAFSSSILNFTASANANSASFNDRINSISGSYATTGSNTFIGNQNIQGDLTVSNTITAQRLVVEYISSSIIYTTGSTRFGDATSDTHQFTGSVLITGSIAVSGSVVNNLTASYAVNSNLLDGLDSTQFIQTGSFGAYTSSFNAFSASMLNTTSSLYAFTASINNYTASNNLTIADILVETASLQAATASLNNFSASALRATASLYLFTASINSYTASNNATVANFQTATASLNAFSASILNYTASNNATVTNFQSATASLNAFSASILNYTASTNATIADILVETASLQSATASLYTFTASIQATVNDLLAETASINLFTASINNYTASNNAAIADILIETASINRVTASLHLATASLYTFTASIQATVNDLLAETASINLFTASINSYTASNNATVTNFQSATSSLNNFSASILSYTASNNATVANFQSATASLNNFSASILSYTSSNNATVVNFQSATASLNAATASLYNFSSSVLNFTASANASSASFNNRINVISGSYATTGSNIFTADQTIQGTLTVNRIVVQTITASQQYSSGSNRFGNDLSNTQVMTGSVSITGSLSVNGIDYINTSSSFNDRLNRVSGSTVSSASFGAFTSSMHSATASIYAFSASINSYTASNNATVANFQSATASLNLFTASINNYTASNNATVTNFQSATASLNAFSASILNTTASINLFTASINSYTASTNLTIADILIETASINRVTASLHLSTASLYTFTASIQATVNDLLAETASINAFSSSILNFTASQRVLNGTYATTGSNVFRGNQIVTGSLFTTGSNTLIGNTNLTGSLNISGSTVQIGNNTLLGDTLLSGSITISGSFPVGNYASSVNIYGDTSMTGYLKFNPQSTNIDTNASASYIYVSGSTNDLYFTQNGNGYNNTTRLRWLEGNLYTGLLHGGLITATTGSTTFNLSSGSGIIVDLGASINDDPYPTIKYIDWNSFTNVPLTYLTSSIQTFVGIDNTGNVFQQTTAFNNGQYNTLISIGTVLHQNKSTVNASITYPNVSYGWKQRSYDFVKAFGPLKLSGLTIITSGSLGLNVGSGTAFADGRNYQVDPNNPSYIVDPGTSVSKIFRYWQSGSEFVQDTNAGAGYTAIDPTQYNNGTTLVSVSPSTPWTNQRVFWYPNSATKGIVVYYGRGEYASSTEALANLSTETFLEVENTKQNAVYLGSITIRYNGVFTTPADYIISPAGIFRSVGGSGGGGTVVTTRLVDLSDVAATGATDGQPLVYNSTAAKWINGTSVTASLKGNADTATSASYALSSSFARNANNTISASYALSSSYSLTGSFAQNARSASYAVTASYADTFLVKNTLTAQTLIVEFVSSSTTYSSGSNKFGDQISDTQQFTGSILVSGSITVSGSVVNNLTASYASNANLLDSLDSTQFVQTGSFGSYTSSLNAFSASILSYTASNNATVTNFQSATASLNNFSASVLSYTASNNTNISNLQSAVTSLNAQTASLLNYTASNNATVTNFQTATSSLNNFSASILSYTASTNATIADILIETASINRVTASLHLATASLYTFTSSIQATVNDILVETASLQSFTASIRATVNDLLLETASINLFTASINTYTASINAKTSSFATTGSNNFIGNQTITGSLLISGSITGLENVINTLTASYAISSSQAISASFATSASQALTASFVLASGVSGLSLNQISSGNVTASVSTNSGSFAVTSGSSTFLFISSSGRIGLGNTNPATTLAIQTTDSAISVGQTVYNYNTQPIGLQIASWGTGYTNAAGIKLHRWTGTAADYVVSYIGNATYSGQIGLDFRINSTSSFNDATSSRMFISPGGNVGINTTTPNTRLDVNGNVLVSGSITVSGSTINSLTASYAVNADTLDGFDSTQFVQTGSFGAYTSSLNLFSASINSYTASINATIADILIETASINRVTASLHSYTASLNAKTGSFATTGSNTFTGNQIINGTITAQTLIVQTVSSSIEFVTGSTKFGSLATNTHQFTGSVSITGSLAVTNGVINNLTASYAVSASRAISSSFAQTASFALNVPVTASYALSSSQAITASFAQTASFALNVPVTASYALSASQAITSSFAITASHALNAPAAGVGASVLFTQSTAANTWTFTHNLGTQYPSINVFDSNDNLIIPTTVNVTYNVITVTFGVPTSGYIVATVGGGLPTISASYANYILQVNSTGVSASWQPFANANVTSASYALTASYVASVANLSTFQIATGSVTASVNVNSGSFTVASGSTAFFFITSSGEVLINGSVAQNVAASRGNLTINGSTSILNLATSNTNAGYLFHGGTDMLMVNAKNGALTFATNNTERARIDASGRFGIGINAPSASLQVGNATSNATNRSTVAILAAASSSAVLDVLSLINTATAANGNGTAINFHNASNYSPTAKIEAVQDLGTSASLRFYTYENTLTEKMRINSSGSVGIGTTGLTGYSLRIGKNITGATSAYGISQNGTVQSDVTVLSIGVANVSNTQATAFILGNYRHFAAIEGSIGAGSAITSQVGYYVESNLTGGTTNYGFQGLLPSSGSRNWNLYMNGTAPNYLAGKLVIGTTTVPGSTLGIANDTEFSINLANIGTGGLSWQIASTSNTFTAGAGKLIFTYGGLSVNSLLTLVQASNSIGINKTSPTATLDVSGSVLITGSLGVTQDITGSNARFSGTITAQTLVIQTVSSSVVYASGSNIFGNLLSNTQQFTGSVTVTGSLAVNGSNVILTNQTSSMSVLSSSFAQSASYARSASYADNLTVNGVLNFNNTLADYATVGSSIVGSNNLFTRNTGSYTSVFVNYTAAKGTSARSGQLMVVWNNGTAQFTDNSTLDVGGDTGYVTMSAAIVTSQIQVNAQTNSSGWVIKSMATYM